MAMLDSGAMINVVSVDFVRRHNIHPARLHPDKAFRIDLPVVRQVVSAKLLVHNRVCKAFFFVAALGYDVLLGMPWLTQCGAVIDFGTQSIGFRTADSSRIEMVSVKALGLKKPRVASPSRRAANPKERSGKSRSSTTFSLTRKLASI